MAKLVVYLDAGHAKVTAGKRSPDSTLMEWEFNNDMQYRIKKRLEAHGITVVLVNPTPDKGSEVPLSSRPGKANSHWVNAGRPSAVFVSLHANAAGNGWSTASGTETYVAKNGSSNSVKCATYVQENIVRDLGTRDRGVKKENFTVIYKASMPSILIEYGFYSSKSEVEMLKSSAKRGKMCEATVKGLCKYFGIAYKAGSSTPSNPPSKPSTSSPFKEGEYNKPVKVTADVLNVRNGRGPSNKALGSLKKGQVVEVWSIAKGSDGDLWGSFRYNPEYIGFIHMGFVEPTAASTPAPSTPKPIAKGEYNSKVKVTADVLNVRKGRGSEHAKLGQLTKGKVIDMWTIDKGSDGDLWGSFRYDANNVGFVHCGFVTPC